VNILIRAFAPVLKALPHLFGIALGAVAFALGLIFVIAEGIAGAVHEHIIKPIAHALGDRVDRPRVGR
jgi:hypothetical protein